MFARTDRRPFFLQLCTPLFAFPKCTSLSSPESFSDNESSSIVFLPLFCLPVDLANLTWRTGGGFRLRPLLPFCLPFDFSKKSSSSEIFRSSSLSVLPSSSDSSTYQSSSFSYKEMPKLNITHTSLPICIQILRIGRTLFCERRTWRSKERKSGIT